MAQEGRGIKKSRLTGPITLDQMKKERRVALVIGNAKYTSEARLKNAVNDAKLVAKTLRGLGFEVIEIHNASQKKMKRTLRTFGGKLKGAGVGLFYYAGHGMQLNGRNYLVPIDANITDELDIEVESVDMASVLARMNEGGSRFNLVVLDACRNNPFMRATRSAQKGLAFVSAPRGTMIAYATAPGTVAEDGKTANSPFSEAFAKHVQTPNTSVEKVFKAVARDVGAATKDRQRPWMSSDFTGEFFFALDEGAATTRVAAPKKMAGGNTKPVDAGKTPCPPGQDRVNGGCVPSQVFFCGKNYPRTITSITCKEPLLKDLSPLKGFTNLKTLNVTGTQVQNLSPLKSLTSLKYLYLTETQVNELSMLEGLTNLQTLDLKETAVRDLGPLRGLKGVKKINLFNTQVSDVGPLKGLTNLRELDLHGTKVSDLRACEKIEWIRTRSMTC